MECISSHQRDNLFSAVSFVKDASFQEKKAGAQDRTQIDEFLDHILEIQNMIKRKTSEVEEFIETLEKITWYNDNIDEDLLKGINELIAVANDWRISLKRNYSSLGFINGRNIATNEVNQLISALDDLKDATNDLESVFFKLPNTPGFKEISTELDLL